MAKRFTISVVISGKDKLSSVLNSITRGAMERIGHKVTELVQRLPQMAIEMVKLGAAAGRQATALDSMAQSFGTSGDAIVSAIQHASNFTIDSMTAMQAANRAMLLDVAKSPPEFERLTKVAVRLGRVMGLDATQSINDFVTAAGRQSIMIADNLGLTIKVGDANATYANQLGKTVTELTKAEQKQAFLNAMLTAGEKKLDTLGPQTLDAATSIEMLGAATTEVKIAFGEMAASIVVDAAEAVGGVESLAASIRNLPQTLHEARKPFRELSEEYVHFEENARGVVVAIKMTREEIEKFEAEKAIEAAAALDLMVTKAESWALTARNAAASTEQATIAIGTWEQGMSDAIIPTVQARSAWETFGLTVEGVIPSVEEYTASLEDNKMALVEAAMSQAQLNTALSDVSDAQIAKIAIGELNLLLQSGALTADQYNIAVTGLQLTFGLTTEQTIGFKESMLALNEQLVAGMITAAEYDEALLLLTSDLPPTTAETMELQRAMDDAAREAQKLTDEAEMLSAMAGDTFVDAAGDAIDETDTWSLALFEAADAAGADAQELALLASGLGIYTDEQIEAALATVALSTTIDQLGTAIANGSLTTAEAIFELRKQIDLMQFSIGVAKQNTSTTRRASGATRENTKERQKAAKAARELARVERELERALARTGDHFVDAIGEMEMATEETDKWALSLFEAADAAGADATELAMLAGALGLYTEEQLEAALAAAAMQEKMEQLGAEIAAGLGMDEAMEKFAEFRESLELPGWLEPGSMTPLEVGIRGIASAMRQLATIEMPALQSGLGPMGGDRVTTNQFNMTVNTRAMMSTVQQDFATMAALVG